MKKYILCIKKWRMTVGLHLAALQKIRKCHIVSRVSISRHSANNSYRDGPLSTVGMDMCLRPLPINHSWLSVFALLAEILVYVGCIMRCTWHRLHFAVRTVVAGFFSRHSYILFMSSPDILHSAYGYILGVQCFSSSVSPSAEVNRFQAKEMLTLKEFLIYLFLIHQPWISRLDKKRTC